jgi:hypothetical protein
MSSAFYPQGMNSWNNRLPQGGYKSWKGKGPFSNPVGVTASHIRPLTNNDPGNVFPTGFGLPRPIKHYRKGTVIPVPVPVLVEDPNNPGKYIEQSLIEYNVNRSVKSSLGSSLGGGNGGTGMISQLIDMPGSFIVKDNDNLRDNYGNDDFDYDDDYDDDGNKIDKECTNCQGVGIVSSWYPIKNLTEKPQENVTNPLLCCNQQRKARQRVLGANTNVKKNYYQTSYMYLYNRCQTFQQREFNFVRGPIDEKIIELFLQYPWVTSEIIEYSKPGDPLSIANYYVAQCNPNFTIETAAEIAIINSISISLLNNGYISPDQYKILVNQSYISVKDYIQYLQSILTVEQYKIVIEYLYQLAADPYNGSVISGPSNPRGCAQVFYKPNNPQFAKQGSVSSSTRILKLNVDTISTAAAQVRKLKGSNLAAQISSGGNVNTPFIYKFKTPACQASTYSGNPFFFQGQHQNKKICSKNTGENNKTFVSVYQHSAGNYIGSTLP